MEMVKQHVVSLSLRDHGCTHKSSYYNFFFSVCSNMVEGHTQNLRVLERHCN